MNAKHMQIIVILIVVAIAIAVVFGVFGIGGLNFFSSSQQQQQQSQDPAQAFLAQVQKNGGVTQLIGQDVTVGTGDALAPGDTVSIAYTGVLPNGTVFDSTSAHNNIPLTLVVAADGSLRTPEGGSLIQGWSQGVAGMKEGGVRLLAIPPSLGYGPNANGPIPANSTLIFELQLVKVTHPGAAAASSTPSTAPTPAH